MQTHRFWQTRVKFKDGVEGTLTIQSEGGRSWSVENIFVLQSIGSIRAHASWSFHFLGRAVEVPSFVPDLQVLPLFDNQVPYWMGAA